MYTKKTSVGIIQAIIFENDADSIKQFKRFEDENNTIFSILDIVHDFDIIEKSVNKFKPDLLILSLDCDLFDIHFLDNLEVKKPKIIVTSCHNIAAYIAYKLNAVYFLVKPLDANELLISIYKTIKFIEMESAYLKESMEKIKDINKLSKNLTYIAISSVDKIELLKINEIVFCKADGKYTEFYTSNNEKKVSSRNIGEYYESLGCKFFRIHHSYIINIKFLVKVIKKDGLYCELINNHFIPVAKRRQEDFLKFINS